MTPNDTQPWLLTLLMQEKQFEMQGHLFPIHLAEQVDEAKWYADFLTRCFFRAHKANNKRFSEGTWNS